MPMIFGPGSPAPAAASTRRPRGEGLRSRRLSAFLGQRPYRPGFAFPRRPGPGDPSSLPVLVPAEQRPLANVDLASRFPSWGRKEPHGTKHQLTAKVHQGSCTVQGQSRKENQDRVVVIADLCTSHQQQGATAVHAAAGDFGRRVGAIAARPMPVIPYSAVFDGHGGKGASSHAAARLQQLIAAGLQPHLPDCLEGVLHEVADLWHSAFFTLDDEILRQSRTLGAVDGTTAVASIHAGSMMLVANAGDSRAVLCRGGKAVRLTCDHVPNHPAEWERIVEAGGRVQQIKGVWRVVLPPTCGGKMYKLCGTSRGLGDHDFKAEGLMTCEPEVTGVRLQPHVDAFTILATDGLWAVATDQDVVDTVRAVMRQVSSVAEAAEWAANELVHLAANRGSTDDTSVIVNIYDWN